MNIFKKKQPAEPIPTEKSKQLRKIFYDITMESFKDSFYPNGPHRSLYSQYYASNKDGTIRFQWWEKKATWIPSNPNPELDKFITIELNKIVKELMS